MWKMKKWISGPLLHVRIETRTCGEDNATRLKARHPTLMQTSGQGTAEKQSAARSDTLLQLGTTRKTSTVCNRGEAVLAALRMLNLPSLLHFAQALL